MRNLYARLFLALLYHFENKYSPLIYFIYYPNTAGDNWLSDSVTVISSLPFACIFPLFPLSLLNSAIHPRFYRKVIYKHEIWSDMEMK